MPLDLGDNPPRLGPGSGLIAEIGMEPAHMVRRSSDWARKQIADPARLSLEKNLPNPPRSRPPPQPHPSATAVLVYELNARDFDRSSNLLYGVFAPTQFAIY